MSDSPARSARAGWARLGHLAGLAGALVPAAVFVHGGALTASLWLDEILYRAFELDRGLRAHEYGRPDSVLVRFVGTYSYSEVRAAFGAFLDRTPVPALLGLEGSLRLPSILAFVGCAVLIYLVAWRRTGSLARATTSAALFTTLPLFLTYAFEARCYLPTALVSLGFVLAAASAVEFRRAAYLAGALGAVAVAFHWWAVCLPAAVALLAALDAFRSRRLDERSRRVLWLALPGILVAVAEVALLALTTPVGGAPFPLFQAKGLKTALVGTLVAPWSQLQSWPRPVPFVAIGAMLVLAVLACRRAGGFPDQILRRTGVVALAGSALVGGVMGSIVFGRHQVPLFAVAILGFGLAAGRVALLLRVALIALNLGLLPRTLDSVTLKGNGRALAGLVRESGDARPGTAVVFQQGFGLGYPDPLNSFGVDFYLNGEQGAHVPLFELPDLEEVSGRRGVFEYFGGGPELVARFATRPHETWDRWLRRRAPEVVWFVAPRPSLPAEAQQQVEFRQALGRAGYRPAAHAAFELRGYPPTVALRVERPPAE